MLHLGLLHTRSTAHKSEPSFSSGMPKSPLNSVENVSFHLDKRRLFISVTTDLGKVLNCRYAFLGIFKFSSNPERSTPDELIMLDEDNTAGDVAVDNVEGEVECFRTKTEGKVDLHEEINQTRPHVPSNFRLLIH